MTHRGIPSPYVGSRPYHDADRSLFFGRDDESSALADLWRGHRLTVVHGRPGSGKTSLLRSGVLPLVRGPAHRVLPVGRTVLRSTFPMAALPEQDPHTFALLSSWSPDASPIRLSGLSVGAFLRRGECAPRFGAPRTTLAAVDQAEQVFRGPPDRAPARERFLAEMFAALAESPATRLLIVVRDERLAEILTAAERFVGGSIARFEVGPLRRAAAIEAVVGPLRGTGRALGPGAAERLVDELRDGPDAVDPPLLQMACRGLWEADAADPRIAPTRPGPEIDRALAASCARTLAGLAADHGVGRGALESWLRAASAPGGSAREIPTAVARAMEDLHLIKARDGRGAPRYELRHPRLAAPVRRLPRGRWPSPSPDPSARLETAATALSDGDHGLARWHAEQAARLCREGDLRLLAQIESFLGDVAHRQGLPVAATAHYRAAAHLYGALPDSAAVAWALTAVGRLKLAEHDRAVEAVEELWAGAGRAPNDPTVQTVLGQALYDAGRPQAALAVLGTVLHRHGDTPEALRARGEILADLGDSAAALRDLDRLDRLDPRDPWGAPSVRAARALALASEGRLDAAQRELREMAMGDGDSGPLLWRVARVQELSGDHDAAARLAVRALAASGPPLAPHARRAATDLVNATGIPSAARATDPAVRHSGD
ncbi:tetratricopeptide repeat protein [Thermomonospora umbrina]|nr:tetratricopeptide repeat protein [Thermomonospora umbrina]